MTDLELLRQYEPALRFTKSERFFPMAVEPYLEKCALAPYAPDAALEYLEHGENRGEPLVARIGKLKHARFYLRFVNKNFDYGWAWRWLIILSVAGLFAGYFWGWTGIEADLALTFFVALFLFMLASPVRLRIIPSALAALAFCALSFVPLQFFPYFNQKFNAAIVSLVLLPIYLVVLFYALMRILKFTIDTVIPEGPGMIMDMLSRATERVAEEAYLQYAQILKREPNPVYYGRVLREKDGFGSEWVILQYHFFYAFNDWRLAANGMNHHEGDWELVSVYLKDGAPYAVLFSQHGSGNMVKWDAAAKVKDLLGADTEHPVVYVALGSHANYAVADVVRSPNMYSPGKLQNFMFWLDGVIHYLFLWLNPDQRKVAAEEFMKRQTNIFNREVLSNLKYGKDKYVVRLPMEIATGDGYRVGPHAEYVPEHQTQSSKFLKRKKSRRETVLPASDAWRCVLLNSEHDWVQYKGLWGVKSWLNEESGPPGPRWERPKKNQADAEERIRWGEPLTWLEELEKNKH